MLVEILIGALVMAAVTLLFTGPGMWSSSWAFRRREKENKRAGGDTKQP